jgi:hypothetical protein
MWHRDRSHTEAFARELERFRPIFRRIYLLRRSKEANGHMAISLSITELRKACDALAFELRLLLRRPQRGEWVATVAQRFNVLSRLLEDARYAKIRSEWKDIVFLWNQLYASLESYCSRHNLDIAVAIEPIKHLSSFTECDEQRLVQT